MSFSFFIKLNDWCDAIKKKKTLTIYIDKREKFYLKKLCGFPSNSIYRYNKSSINRVKEKYISNFQLFSFNSANSVMFYIMILYHYNSQIAFFLWLWGKLWKLENISKWKTQDEYEYLRITLCIQMMNMIFGTMNSRLFISTSSNRVNQKLVYKIQSTILGTLKWFRIFFIFHIFNNLFHFIRKDRTKLYLQFAISFSFSPEGLGI